MRSKRTLVIGLVFLLSGCGLSVPPLPLLEARNGMGSTAEEAVLSARPTGEVTLVQSTEVLGTRNIGAHKVVIYRVRERTGVSSTRTMLGYGIAEPDGAGWKVLSMLGPFVKTTKRRKYVNNNLS